MSELKILDAVNDNYPPLRRDIAIAQDVYRCKLVQITIILMTREITRRYKPNIDFEELLDFVIAQKPGLSDGERQGYEYVLRRVFFRRGYE